MSSSVAKRKRVSLFISDEAAEGESSTSSSTTVLSNKKKITKAVDDTIPLPKPFPLPKHFRQDVECALRSKKMTTETRRAFFSAIASSMLNFKRYPTSEDYRNVAESILAKYEFLGCSINYGTPEVR